MRYYSIEANANVRSLYIYIINPTKRVHYFYLKIKIKNYLWIKKFFIIFHLWKFSILLLNKNLCIYYLKKEMQIIEYKLTSLVCLGELFNKRYCESSSVVLFFIDIISNQYISLWILDLEKMMMMMIRSQS